jgi:hypothetical protein
MRIAAATLRLRILGDVSNEFQVKVRIMGTAKRRHNASRRGKLELKLY